MKDKESFLHHLANELDAMEHQIDAVEAEVRAEQPDVADDLREKLDQARSHAEAAHSAAEHEWAHHRERTESAWKDLKKAFSQVRSRLGD